MRMHTCMLSCVRLFVTPWTVACRAPLSIGFSRQEYWSGLPFPSSGHLPNQGNKPRSSALQTFSFTSAFSIYQALLLLLLSLYILSDSWNSMDYSPPDSSVHGISQAGILEWVAISFSRGSSRPRDQTHFSCIQGRLFNLWATREANEMNKQPLCIRHFHKF